MRIEVQLTQQPIPETIPAFGVPALAGPTLASEAGDRLKPGLRTSEHTMGAWVEFRGVVRSEENGAAIAALEYEAYPEMALTEMRRLLNEISEQHPCLAAKVIHRTGLIPVGEAAIYVGIAGRHRAEAFAALSAFMDRLKRDVPIWKVGTRSAELRIGADPSASTTSPNRSSALLPLAEARALIQSHCQPVPSVRVTLTQAVGCLLREPVHAPEDLPPTDKSTRDGYAILADDKAASFTLVDTLHAADWNPRRLQPGEAVRVATGASLPCTGLRVVMQEDVERSGDQIRIVAPDDSANVRRRGEDVQSGAVLLAAGTVLHGGALALLATAGCVEPVVSPRLKAVHFTTGDEIVPPAASPGPGQIRDSNSHLIRGLLEKLGCDVQHQHLVEDFAHAKAAVAEANEIVAAADVLLISGGASVGDKDFTRPLLESLGYELAIRQVNLRPGKPLLFGTRGRQIAFGLPGNPLSHFVCFHAFVAVALAQLSGRAVPPFRRAKLAEPLRDAHCARETLWPARLVWGRQGVELQPLAWSSSGDVTCLAETNALLRVPPGCERFEAGTLMEFLAAE